MENSKRGAVKIQKIIVMEYCNRVAVKKEFQKIINMEYSNYCCEAPKDNKWKEKIA